MAKPSFGVAVGCIIMVTPMEWVPMPNERGGTNVWLKAAVSVWLIAGPPTGSEGRETLIKSAGPTTPRPVVAGSENVLLRQEIRPFLWC